MEIIDQDVVIKLIHVIAKVIAETDVSIEVPVEYFYNPRGGHPTGDHNVRIQIALLDEAKRKIASGNCSAKIVGIITQATN